MLTLYANENSSTVKDIGAYIESLDIGFFDQTHNASPSKSGVKIVDNNDPEMLDKHRIEVKVNELLKTKLEEELKYERAELKNQKSMLEEKEKSIQKETENFEKLKKEFEDAKPLQIERTKVESKLPEFKKFQYRLRTGSKDGKRDIDSEFNEIIIFSYITPEFGPNRNYESFLKFVSQLDVDQPKTSLAFIISDSKLFDTINGHVTEYYSSIESKQDPKSSFSKITLLHAPFLEKKISEAKPEDKPKVRSKHSAQIKNFLISNTLGNEKYALYLESNIVDIPKKFVEVLIGSGADIATLRVDTKGSDDSKDSKDSKDPNDPKVQPVEKLHNLQSWLGARVLRGSSLDEKATYEGSAPDPDTAVKDSANIAEISASLDKYKLGNKPDAKIELKSVGGTLVFLKSEVLHQGVTFPPYNIIGATWEKQGVDGIETEGLCYQANAIGYKCWGFPNLVAYQVS